MRATSSAIVLPRGRESRFALDFENRRYRHAETALELGVGIDEGHAEASGELSARASIFPSPAAHQEQIAAMQVHRGILAGG